MTLKCSIVQKLPWALSRELTYTIQKWNVNSDGFHPILVENARVDWLALKDDNITQKFSILLEGILQDVFSQRTFSAWQGAQPQKITVSLRLLGTCLMVNGFRPPNFVEQFRLLPLDVGFWNCVWFLVSIFEMLSECTSGCSSRPNCCTCQFLPLISVNHVHFGCWNRRTPSYSTSWKALRASF